MIDTTAAATFMAENKGDEIVVTLADGTEVTGTAISVNSKGVNITVDGKVRSFSLTRVADLALTLPAELDGDEIADLIEAGELDPMDDDEDGMTTAEVAELFDISAKELRVHLRKLAMGVGKGRTYGLSAADVAKVREYIDGLTVEA